MAKHEDDLYVKDSVLPKLTAYLLTSKNNHDRYSHNNEANDSATKVIDSRLPETVLSLATGNPYLGTHPGSKLTQTLVNRKKLGLTRQQIFQLLSADRALRKKVDSARHNLLDTAEHFNWGRFDNHHIKSVLTPAQLTQLMLLRHQDEVNKIASDKWNVATANNATGNFNQQTAILKLKEYYLKYNTLQDMFSGNKKAADSAIDALNNQTPDSLHALMSGNPKWGADTLGLMWAAWQNKVILGLRKSLADSLLWQSRMEKKLQKLAYKFRDSLRFSRTDYEAAKLPQLLTDSQYAKLLIIRFQPDALNGAKKNWDELTKLSLATGYNQETTVNSIAIYNLSHIIIEKKYANDASAKKRLLRELDLTMPAALAILKHSKKSGASKPSSGTYVW